MINMVLEKNTATLDSAARKSVKKALSRTWKKVRYRRISDVFPIFMSLRQYTWRTLFLDCVAGITVGLTHIPQSMGTGMVANLGPMYGIYMTFFPGLIYALLGSSFHNSVGAFAPSAALVGVSVARIRAIFAGNFLPNQTVEIVREADFPAVSLQHLEIAVAITLMAGFMQLALAFCRLDFLTRIFSHTVLDPFNLACSLQIILVQIPNMLGVNLDLYYGLNKHIGMLVLFFTNIGSVLGLDTLLAIITVSVIITLRDFIQPKLVKWIKIIIPIEFIVVMVFIGISYGMNLRDNYGVRILGSMPVGFPAPKVPRLKTFMPYVVFEGLLSALLAIAFNMQAMRPAARKHGYRVASSQELIALGSANVFSSFFSCFVCNANIGRISIQESMGSRSQVATIVACLLTGLLLAFASQTLYYLPTAVIAAIITLTLSMNMRLFGDLPNIWKSCRLDAFQWILTFTSCVLLDLEWGLIIGLCVSWVRLQHQLDQPHLQSVVPHDREVSSQLAGYRGQTTEFSSDASVRVLRMGQSLNYANTEKFIRRVLVVVDQSAPLSVARQNSARTRGTARRNGIPSRKRIGSQMDGTRKSIGMASNGGKHDGRATMVFDSTTDQSIEDTVVEHIIIDCAALEYIDSAGVRAFTYLTAGLIKRKVTLWLAECSGPVKKTLTLCVDTLPPNQLVPTVNDAMSLVAAQEASLATPSQLQSWQLQDQMEPGGSQAATENQFWPVCAIPEDGRLSIELHEPNDPDDRRPYDQSSLVDDLEFEEMAADDAACDGDGSGNSYPDQGLWLINGGELSDLAAGRNQSIVESNSDRSVGCGITKC